MSDCKCDPYHNAMAGHADYCPVGKDKRVFELAQRSRVMDIKQILDSGSVVRYHACLIEKKQTNAEHQWEVGVLLRYIYPQVSAELLFYALTHDAGELFTSDVAAPVKRQFPDLAKRLHLMEAKFCDEVLGLPTHEFSEEELLAVKYADILSGIYFTSRRLLAGDQTALPIRDNWLKYLGSLDYLNTHAQKAVEALQ